MIEDLVDLHGHEGTDGLQEGPVPKILSAPICGEEMPGCRKVPQRHTSLLDVDVEKMHDHHYSCG